jgi:hypothetical protein
MDEPTRRAWSKPELIVLVRGKPEESVLAACKNRDTQPSAVNEYVGCASSDATYCYACDTGSES